MPASSSNRVSLCMIVRNEEHNLPECLAPVRQLFDEIVVVDTGSTENTKDVAASLGARVVESPWTDDFSAARNESLRHATGDWIFWLDADDRVNPLEAMHLARLFASLSNRGLAYAMRCVLEPAHASDAAQVVGHVRLFPNRPQLRWKGRVHENLSFDRAGCKLVWTGIRISHIGYQDLELRSRKLERDLRLLTLEFAANPADPDVLFYLGSNRLSAGVPAQALGHLLKSLELTREANSRKRKLFALIAKNYLLLGNREQGLAVTEAGLRSFPDDPELLFQRAEMLCRLAIPDWANAEACLLRLIRSAPQCYMELGVPAELGVRHARFALGILYLHRGDRQRAEQVLQELLADFPDDSKAWVGLGQLYLQLRRWHDVRYVVRQLQKCPCGDVLALILEASAHLERGEFAQARPLIDEAIVRAPRLLWARHARSDLLLREGRDPQAAIAAQHDILRLDPANEIARRNLELLQQPARQHDRPPAALSSTVTVGAF